MGAAGRERRLEVGGTMRLESVLVVTNVGSVSLGVDSVTWSGCKFTIRSRILWARVDARYCISAAV